METSENIEEIAKAMNNMQSEMEIASKEIKAYKYKYADLATVWGVLKEPLTKNGLMLVQDAFTNEKGASVQTQITHISGQWIKSSILTIPGGNKDAHGAGSALTYGKRYQLCSLLGVFVGEEDDDGAKAQLSANAKEKAKPAPPPVNPFNEEQIDAWLDKWSDHFDPHDLERYCQNRAKYFGHKVPQTVAEIAQDDELFEKNMNKWLEQNPQ